MSLTPAVRPARLFFALWPDAAARARLSAWAGIAHAAVGGRMTAAANLHVTLFFLGAVERARIAALEAAAETVAGPPFALTFDRVGYWRHNRIVWAGAQASPPALIALEASLRSALARAGWAGDDRPYQPHVTLVRNAVRRPAALTLEPYTLAVREFVLVESEPDGGGVRYVVRRCWPLPQAIAPNGP